jgi:monofunctional biosynthetic peptidoglycan transglycosylase
MQHELAARPRPARRSWRRVARRLIVALLALPLPFVVAYRFLPPPVTPLMLIRLVQGEPLEKTWVPLRRISPELARAVIASEDTKFCRHHGFDWQALGEAWRAYRAGDALRGASTISMQTAKNLFLWPGRSFVRKGIEAYLTVLLELLWNKPRILEVYLNVIEWGHGVYGAEMAARTHFHKSAARLSRREAALLAAVLPNPRDWSPEHPSAYIRARAAVILHRMPEVEFPRVDGRCR